MAVENLSDLECADSFVINFTATLECTFVLDNSDAITVGYGTNTHSKGFIFTRGSNDAGAFDDHVSYSVDGGSPSVNSPPTGVTYAGQFNVAPDLTDATGPRDQQISQNGYTFTINITEPVTGAVNPFSGTTLGITVTLGFNPS